MSGTNREVAHRVFAAEYDEATHSYSESDEERAPNYVVTPTGARVNRLFFVGVLTEVEQVSDDVLRARIADPTGAFVVYAGQYQPDEMAFLEDAEPPLFVAVTGKARTFSPDDSERVFTSVRPESINEVDAEVRDRWTASAAERTIARVATARAAMDLDATGDELAEVLLANGVPPSTAHGIPRAFDAYGTTEAYLAAMADLAVDALALVAGETDEVQPPSVAPNDPGSGTVDPASLADAVDGAAVELDPTAVVDERAAAEDEEIEGQESAATTTADADASTGSPREATGAEETTAEDSEPSSATEATAEPDGDPTAADPAADGQAEPREAGDAADESSTAAADDADDPTERTGAADRTGATVEDADAAETSMADGEDLGDFEPGGVEGEDADDTPGDESPTEDAEDVLDDEERERLEEEYGTFSTGTEVDEPGEAGIEPEAGPIEPDEAPEEPATDEAAETDAADATDGDDGDEAAETDEPEDGPAGDPDEAATDEREDGDSTAVDLETAAVEAMEDLDDGDGAVREEVIAALVDDHGVDPGAAEEAIQDALMAGKCYEPADERVKPI